MKYKVGQVYKLKKFIDPGYIYFRIKEIKGDIINVEELNPKIHPITFFVLGSGVDKITKLDVLKTFRSKMEEQHEHS